MAVAKGKESIEGQQVKRYIGVAPVSILAINPSKDEMEKIYGSIIESEPNYLSETEINGEKVSQIRIEFITQTDVEKTGIDMKSKATFFVAKAYRYNRDGSKIQVINKYGETTWLPVEDAKEGRVPESLSWFEPAEFRPAYVGEEELIGFIKAYLNIPNKSYRNNTTGQIVEIPNKADAEARLDNINDYFSGNVKELKDIIAYQPNNKVKVLFGVRTTEDGKQYQAVYTQRFLKNSVTDYSYLKKDLEDRKAAGSYPTTEFIVIDLHEYSVQPTEFKQPEQNGIDNPWGESAPW